MQVFRDSFSGSYQRYFPWISSLTIHFIFALAMIWVIRTLSIQPVFTGQTIAWITPGSGQPRFESKMRKQVGVNEATPVRDQMTTHMSAAQAAQSQPARVAGPQKGIASSELAKIADQYVSEISSTLQQNKIYPSSARALGQQGRVVVKFTVLKTGHVDTFYIAEASEYERLNQAALLTVQKIAAFKPIPAELNRASWEFTVPIEFQLN